MGWLLGGKIVNMILSFFVSLATARYLGPDNFGSINYVAAYVSFFSSITSLGLSVIVIKEISMGKEDDNEVIWTGILMRFLTAVFSTIAVIALVSITDKSDPLLVKIAILESIAILASAFDTFMYWFQGKLLGKYTSIASVVAYIGMSLYRIYLLANNADILWFAFATSVDTLLLSLILMLCPGERVPSESFHKAWKKPDEAILPLYDFRSDRNPLFENRPDHVKTDAGHLFSWSIYCSVNHSRALGHDSVRLHPVRQPDPL